MLYTYSLLALVGVLILKEYYPTSAMRSDAAKFYGWLTRKSRRHYVQIIFAATFLFCAWALWLGLARVPNELGKLLVDLKENAGNDVATRSIITAITALIAGIAIFGTIIVQSIRVWTNERQITTIEQGHVTDRITKAVEQLGAEKTVKRILKDADENEVRNSDNVPVVIETTEPNLEVRLGGIYALERIAQDSERDHITIMEILCAYIRENAKAKDARDHVLGEYKDYSDPSISDREAYREERGVKLSDWLLSLPPPRIDIQAALTVIGRRGEGTRATERSAEFRLYLYDSNLRWMDLSGARLEEAKLGGARLERANLSRAQLEGADLGEAWMGGANLSEAQMKNADLWRARLEGARLHEARLEGAHLGAARLEGADLFAARLDGASLYEARLEGAFLRDACLEGAYLREARLERADLWRARLERADLWRARLEGAHLREARLEGAHLREAHLEGADLREAWIEGADLREVDFRKAHWAGASNRASLAQFADLRGGQSLTQAQLDQMIGNASTLLPDTPAPDTKKPFRIYDCWASPPEGFEILIRNLTRYGKSEEEIRAKFLCAPDTVPKETGLRLPLDAPYPEGHPLARRE